LVDAAFVATTVEVGSQKKVDDSQGRFERDGSFPDGEAVGVIVSPGPFRGVIAEAESTPDTLNFIGDHRLTVSGTTEDNSPIRFAPSHGFGGRAHELWVVTGFRGIGSKVLNRVTPAFQVFDDGLFVIETGVVGSDGDGERHGSWEMG
jgi:hypothetical protein